MKAFQTLERLNLRRHRAMVLAAEVSRIIEPHLKPESNPQDTHDAIKDLFFQQGVEVLTDYTRSELGLPPRGPDGWTTEEILSMERIRLERMLTPFPHFIPIKDKPE